MRLCRLLLKNFRNYDRAEVLWHDKINIIRGLNAQGKSNLLEAISYLSLASSFRSAKDSELLKWQKDFFYLEGQLLDHDQEHIISAGYSADKTKKWKIDGQKKTKLTEIIGCFHSVIFSPDDLNLVKNGPDYRRQFINRQMVQLYPDFCQLLLIYNQVLKQRNNVLKKAFVSDLREQLAPWDEQVAHYGAKIIKWRSQVCRQLTPYVQDFYRHLAKGEEIDLRYNSFLGYEETVRLQEKEIQEALLEKLKSLFPVEKARGISLCGPHRDDIEITIDNFSARRFASQGQQRSAVLALKLAEVELARAVRGSFPVLLLDDVMSELDAERQKQLINVLDKEIQTFITATDLSFSLVAGKTFFIQNGTIIEQ